MLHPSTSVVIAVDIAWDAYCELIAIPKMSAITLPMMYPSMFTAMIPAAVNSMFSPFLRHMMRVMVIVRMVRSSSSSTPASLHRSATAACSSAKRCMIMPVLMFFMARIRFLDSRACQGGKPEAVRLKSEVRNFAPILQLLLYFHHEKSAVHPFLQTIRPHAMRTYSNNVYFRKTRLLQAWPCRPLLTPHN